MDKIEMTKKVVKIIVRISAGFTVSNLIMNNTQTTKTTQKIKVIIGAYVITMIVRDASDEYIDKKIDELVASYNAMFHPVLET